jgi:pimeloyl-ACP methyl ester carboxylesterase
MKSRKLIFISFPIVLLASIYFLGPEAPKPEYNPVMPEVPVEAASLEQYIFDKEKAHHLKPNNEARIIWADSNKQKTKYAVIYLHGFSASQMEGDPIHKRFAKEFGCNLYLSRIADHGVDTTESLLLFTADRAWNSAKEALAIGKSLGEKVIILSTSTGGTLALMLAAQYPDQVYGLINLSPNIAINNPAAFLLNDPWGLQIARMVMKGDYRITDASPEKSKYWNGKYRLESIVALEELVESSMTETTFKKITQPCLTLYYYKNEQEQDPEVKVSAMLEMNKLIATPDSMKVGIAMPETGAHVIGGSLVSKDVEGVYREIKKFTIEKLKLLPATATIASVQ